ncbi:MAG: PDZ domain-containing protein [Planctomycetota bacterium]|jgi:hypothetical protein
MQDLVADSGIPVVDTTRHVADAIITEMILRAALLILICGLGADAAPGQSTTGPPASGAGQHAPAAEPVPDPAVDADELRALVSRLGSGSFQEREEATRLLLEVGSAAYDALEQAYRRTDDYEVRLRIQDVVEIVYFGEELFRTMGFLGIRLRIVDSTDDARVSGRQTGVLLVGVVPRTAAARAGLLDQDLIVEVDGQPLPADLTDEEFSRTIREAGPGTGKQFTVFRGDRRLLIDVVLGQRPLAFFFEDRNSGLYLRKLDETSRNFHRWWKQRFGTSTRTDGPRSPGTTLEKVPNPPARDPSRATPPTHR